MLVETIQSAQFHAGGDNTKLKITLMYQVTSYKCTLALVSSLYYRLIFADGTSSYIDTLLNKIAEKLVG